jgi:hypothetical protein
MLYEGETILENHIENESEYEMHPTNHDNYDIFLDNHTYKLICFFEDLKKTFVLNPDFLSKCTTTLFTNFLIDNLLEYKPYYELKYHYLEKYFQNEIEISFQQIYIFLHQIFTKTFMLEVKDTLYNKWKHFCYTHSTEPYI